jgi:RND family efflux transporter MFP subunit
MRKFFILGVLLAAIGGAAIYFLVLKREQPAEAADQAQAGQAQAQGRGGRGGRAGAGTGNPGGGGGFGGPGGGGGFRPPMTVEVAKVSRGNISSYLSVVGNLIGEATVEVAPKTGGRLTSVTVKLGDRVRQGQVLAKLDDKEIVEQVRQAEASHKVAEATIRQREADLNLALTNVERSRNLYGRQLLPKQTLDDAEARYTAAVAQLDLSQAQLAQSASRLEELRINLANTNVVSPVDGFVGKRNVDPGAWVSQNAGVASIVDISRMRLVANVVEKDLRLVGAGDKAIVEVDAYPGEKFSGQIARVAPVLDPSTRTATMEVEIPNPTFRLKPGMYARVSLEVETHEHALLIPKVALVDSEGQRGVYQANEDNRAQFKAVKVGLEDPEKAEILEGLAEGETIVSTGAGALRRNDQLAIAGQAGQGGRGNGQGGRGTRGGQGAGQGAAAGAGAGTPGTTGQPPATNSDQAPTGRPNRRPPG